MNRQMGRELTVFNVNNGLKTTYFRLGNCYMDDK